MLQNRLSTLGGNYGTGIDRLYGNVSVYGSSDGAGVMTRYTSGKARPVHTGDKYDNGRIVENADDAAKVMAGREARRIYGKRGFCHHVRRDCWRADGSSITYEAFIGVPWQNTGCSGKNIWLAVNINE